MSTEVNHTLGAGKDYTSLAAWYTAQVRDLVTLDEIDIISVYGAVTTAATGTNISGFTTSNTNRIIFKAAAGEKYDIPSDTGASLESTATSWIIGGTGNCTTSQHVTFQDLKLENLSHYILGTLVETVERCYLHCKGYSSAICYSSAPGHMVRNSVIHYEGTFNHPFGTALGRQWHNCTAIAKGTTGSQFALWVDYTAPYNCIAYCERHITAYARIAFSDETYTDYNVQSENDTDTIPDLYGANSNSVIVETTHFTDFAGDDYSLPSGSPLIGIADNLYSDFQDDFLGNPRPATGAWDVGAFQYQAPAVGGTNLAKQYGKIFKHLIGR